MPSLTRIFQAPNLAHHLVAKWLGLLHRITADTLQSSESPGDQSMTPSPAPVYGIYGLKASATAGLLTCLLTLQPLLATTNGPALANGTSGPENAGGPASPEPPRKLSFVDSITEFRETAMTHPKIPFEVVPGKDPNAWSFVIEPYVWATAIDGKTGVGSFPVMNINANAKKLIQNLDWGIMGKAEVRKGRWGVIADGYYADISASGELGGTLYQDGNISFQQAFASLALAYRVIDTRMAFVDVYAGARYNYLGLQMDLKTDSAGINALGEQISNSVAAKISSAVQTQLAIARAQIASAVAANVENNLSSELMASSSKTKSSVGHMKELQRLTGDSLDHRSGGGRETLNSLERGGLKNILASSKGAIREFIQAQSELDVAKSKGAVSATVQNRANTAKAKLAKSISKSVKNALPTYATGDQWWIDPIIGLRGQVNITRWLYLAAQGDVGGFGAGSQVTWNTQATVGVNFTRNVFAELGYRSMYVDYNNNNFLYQMNSYGLVSSIGVKF